ncbi:MAG: hypothetical protein QGH73_05060 [Rhodospirillales bacterium]|jgi:hypothetical protein|nr:hypothetical protein [Rhodospirillaceae bacterium]MDP6429849.1 hypothetical protein [Rhodospirillales bacterium]MDP6643062.1 hypothetical protein [Rhodospirillales bacterium]MDP6841026.1 hypothetical protein [Rhodospirillales bacterium]|tara:strand:- start:2183 stop:2440 length:258 start_codon:yes stop_codon:yes gene_type:complete
MWKFDWTHYVAEQIKWAEILITKADDIPGYESTKLRDKGGEVLAHVSRLIGENLTGDEHYDALLERLIANGHDITRFKVDGHLTH